MSKPLRYIQSKNSYGVDSRRYASISKSNRSTNSLNSKMSQWVISNLKHGETVPNNIEIQNVNSQYFIRFIRGIKNKRIFNERLKQITSVHHLSWLAKSRKVERLIHTDKYLSGEYMKLMSMYSKQENTLTNSCNENSDSCLIIVAILSLL